MLNSIVLFLINALGKLGEEGGVGRTLAKGRRSSSLNKIKG